MVKLKIGGIKEASTIDYPGEMVSVIFFCQCPFKCPFCQNWSLVRAEDCTTLDVELIFKQLHAYRKFITGICVTGGEPTIQIEGLIELFQKTHSEGLLNKLDSNGFYFKRIHKLLELNLINYAAIDAKAAFNPVSYGRAIGVPSLGKQAIINLKKTIQLLNKFSIPFEIRTTIVPNFNDQEQEIAQIAQQLQELEVSCYILQQFRASGGTLDPQFSTSPATERTKLIQLAKIGRQFISDLRIRTIECGEENI
ncbi:MAG: anaerobic ribonucleoside-triphosphate reductase activating protein [Candidatus Helarchaeota archaeon]